MAAAGLAGALVFGFFIFINAIDQTETPNVPRAQGVVALTGGAERISDAVDLVAEGRADRLLISGVNQNTSGEEIARHNPRFRPLYQCCIELGYEALNTMGNAAETRRWARAHGVSQSLIVVTSNYHMPRALLEIGRVLPGVKLLPYSVVTHHTAQMWSHPQMTRVVAVEYIKYVAALMRTTLFSAELPTIALPTQDDGRKHAALKQPF